MSLKETIKKNDEEFDKNMLYQWCFNDGAGDDETEADIKEFIHSRDSAILEAYKEELRGEIGKTEAIVPPETRPEIFGIHREGAYNQGYESAISDVLAIINKKTEV